MSRKLRKPLGTVESFILLYFAIKKVGLKMADPEGRSIRKYSISVFFHHIKTSALNGACTKFSYSDMYTYDTLNITTQIGIQRASQQCTS